MTKKNPCSTGQWLQKLATSCCSRVYVMVLNRPSDRGGGGGGKGL